MKKILCSLMAMVVIVSFSLTAFAETSVNYTFVDTDGFIYHFGQFDDGDTDAGIIVNGKPFSLKNGIYKGEYANAFVDAKTKNNLFGMGFIVNEGKNFLCTGYWKVYKNANEKQKIFRKYEMVRETMIHLISHGLRIEEIIDIYKMAA